MHELSVTESILDISVRYAQAAGATRISDIYLVLGQISSIVDDSVQFYWDFVSQGSLAEGAHLHFQRIPAKLECQGCGHSFQLSGDSYTCPQCGSQQIKIVSGEEFYVESIEVEKAELDQ